MILLSHISIHHLTHYEKLIVLLLIYYQIFSEIKYINQIIPFFVSFYFPIEKCPGVCVAERLSGFCEAILDIPGICASTMKCCVSKQIFEGEKPPEGIVIPSRNKNKDKKPEKPEVTTTSSPRSPAQVRPLECCKSCYKTMLMRLEYLGT